MMYKLSTFRKLFYKNVIKHYFFWPNKMTMTVYTTRLAYISHERAVLYMNSFNTWI